MKIFIYHPYSRDNPYTSLAGDYAAGVTSLQVKNTNGFASNKYAVLGSIGFEQAELVQTGTVTPPSTLAGFTTVYPHNADSKVIAFDYNQINIYRSTTGINGSYSVLATINIQIDNDTTPYEDTNSQSTYYYKFSYYNSAASLESSLSDPIAATGFVFYSLKTLIDRVLSLFGDTKNEFIQRYEIADYLNEFYERAQRLHAVATRRSNINWTTFTVQSGVDEYVLPGDFLMEKAVKVSQDGGVTWPFNATNINVDHLGSVNNTNVKYGYSIYNNTIKLDPPANNSTDMIKIFYTPMPISLLLQTDALIAPFQNSTSMFVKYALGMAKLKDSKDDWSDLTGTALSELKEFISYIKQTQSRHPRYSQLVDQQFP